MTIAFVTDTAQGATNRLLSRFAASLQGTGLRICGTIQQDTPRTRNPLCDMDVTILPDGPVIRISQDLGPAARGCRLDPEALELAVARTEARLAEGADLLIVNKFGKHEAGGRGFRDAIAMALEAEIPVLVGLGRLNRDAFMAFTGGEGQELAPTDDALRAWAKATLGQTV